MNQEDVLARLRDIHLPADLAASTSIEFAAWPFIALAIIVGVILATRYWKRNRWRRRAIVDLSRILHVEDLAAQWSMLLAFAGGLSDRARRPLTLPNVAYRRPESISDAERTELIDTLSAEIRQ